MGSSPVVSLVERNTSGRSDERKSEGRLSFNRRRVLTGAGTAVLGVGAIGALSGNVAAWEDYEVRFNGCSSVWIIVDEYDMNWRENDPDRTHPPMVKVVVERNGEAVCETVLFDDNDETVPGQFGDRPLVKFDGEGDDILAVIKYNANQNAICYSENGHRCANTPNTVDWRDASCADDLLALDADRFNNPCSERAFIVDGSDLHEPEEDDNHPGNSGSNRNDNARGSGNGEGSGNGRDKSGK